MLNKRDELRSAGTRFRYPVRTRHNNTFVYAYSKGSKVMDMIKTVKYKEPGIMTIL